ncbi:hypothetical protein EH223_19825 [candidate division KSB1 bacterium]|nr:hypothetical protein [candidate division KSB1 bacterium]RQW00193.1 MAG: hypothetical protein EH223_19825 [candidate division KSB1 bacterium]
MRKAFIKCASFALMFFLLISVSPFSGCDVDHGLGLSKSRIRGRVILPDMSQRPDYFEAVQVIAITKKLDAADISLNDVVISNYSVDLSQPTPAYDLPAPYSKYELVAAVWKHREKGWDYTKIFGFYGFDPDSFKFTAEPIYLTKEQPVIEDIDIICDWILVSE